MNWYILTLAALATGMAIFLLALPFTERISWMIRLQIAKDTRKFAAWRSSLYLPTATSANRQLAIALIIATVLLPIGCWFLTGRLVLVIATGIIVWFGPLGIYRLRHQQILDRIDNDLPGAVDALVASVRSGRSLQQAIEDVGSRTSGPVSVEFNLIAKEQSMTGLSLEVALLRARDRIQLESFTLISSALAISLTKGGDILSILERIAESLRELLKIRKKLRTETAQIRMQEKCIIAMTPLFCTMVCSFDDEIPHILFDTILGNLLLAIVIAIQCFSIFWIRRIIRATI
jgi:tight adherence protein B